MYLQFRPHLLNYSIACALPNTPPPFSNRMALQLSHGHPSCGHLPFSYPLQPSLLITLLHFLHAHPIVLHIFAHTHTHTACTSSCSGCTVSVLTLTWRRWRRTCSCCWQRQAAPGASSPRLR